MLVKENGQKTIIPKDSPFAEIIRTVVNAFEKEKLAGGGAGAPPQRNEVKVLWRELRQEHKAFLYEVAIHRGGIRQPLLESKLDVDWKGLRGLHNGLARICGRLGIEKPVRETGYTAANRSYHADPDVAATIIAAWKRDQP